MSVRRRLLATSLTTLAVGLGAVVVVGNVLLARRVDAEASSVLRATADAEVAALSVTASGITVRETLNDARLDRRAWVLEGDRVVERAVGASPKLDRAAVALGRRRTTAEMAVEPEETRLHAVPVFAPGSTTPAGAVVVAYSLESLENLQHEVLAGSVIVALLVLLAGGLAIRSALDGALRPVAQMTQAAEDWGAHDLDRRFGLGPAHDELTALAATLDHLLARIAASRRHEQRFAAEVAHELRTPLASLQLHAELALAGDGGDAEHRAALHTILGGAGRLNAAIDALLAVARQEIDPAHGAVDLAASARDFDGVDVSAPPDLPLAEGDPDIAHRALAPLVENARNHARTTVRVVLSSSAGRVRAAVHDDGPGLDPALGERAFEPGARGDGESPGGAGLGLPLARRLARSCGGDVVSGDGPGGCFVLELPALGSSGGS